MSADGTKVAVTDDAGVLVMGLSSSSKGSGGGMSFSPIGAPIKPPAHTVGLNAVVVAFDPGAPPPSPKEQLDRASLSESTAVLAVGWNDDGGTTAAVSLHAVGEQAVTPLWEHVRKCPAGTGENLIQANGLQISPGAAWVVLGSWGCAGAPPHALANAAMLRGRGGDGSVAYEATMSGQVWAASVDAWEEAGEAQTVFGFSSWAGPQPGGTKAQVAAFAPTAMPTY